MLSKGGKKHGGAFAGRVERPYILVPLCFLPSVSGIELGIELVLRLFVCAFVCARALAQARQRMECQSPVPGQWGQSRTPNPFALPSNLPSSLATKSNLPTDHLLFFALAMR